MADIINLNKARKRAARNSAERQAAENRVRYGRSKAEKQRDAVVQIEAARRLDLIRREPCSDESIDDGHDRLSAREDGLAADPAKDQLA